MSRMPTRAEAVIGLTIASLLVLISVAVLTASQHRPSRHEISGLCPMPHTGTSDCRGAP